MKILVTGAKGFVGRNLCENLKAVRDGKNRTRPALQIEDVFEYDLDTPPAELDHFCAEADFVFNLAGVNRPKNNDEFMQGNFGFASTLLEDAEEQLSGHSKKRLNHFLRKVENLRGETRMLHEYATQISSEYQAQVDIDQNRVMKVLTIVTAIFLPLSLIAGWYGMNFPNMPLLGWRYGYITVAAVSALVVALLIWYFKRKKWF